MSGLPPRLRTLFRSGLVHVFDYRCTGHDNDGEVPQACEIVLPRMGAYQRRDAHGTFLADPNQVLFYNRGEPYDIRHPIQGGDSSTVFVLAPSLLIEMMRVRDRDVENNPHKIFRRSHIPVRTRLQLLQYQLPGLRDRGAEPLAWEEQIISAVAEILQALHQDQPVDGKETPGTRRAHHDQMQAVKAFLNANVHAHLQLEQISSAVHLSPFHVCRIFKRYTGMTLHQYTQRLRLFNAAEQMMESPRTRLDLLALEYGFSNHGHFTTSFQRLFGIRPSEFRQMSKILKA